MGASPDIAALLGLVMPGHGPAPAVPPVPVHPAAVQALLARGARTARPAAPPPPATTPTAAFSTVPQALQPVVAAHMIRASAPAPPAQPSVLPHAVAPSRSPLPPKAAAPQESLFAKLNPLAHVPLLGHLPWHAIGEGLLHGAEGAGIMAGTMLDPAAMELIPGTPEHAAILRMQQANTERAEEQREEADALAAYRNAQAYRLMNPAEKPVAHHYSILNNAIVNGVRSPLRFDSDTGAATTLTGQPVSSYTIAQEGTTPEDQLYGSLTGGGMSPQAAYALIQGLNHPPSLSVQATLAAAGQEPTTNEYAGKSYGSVAEARAAWGSAVLNATRDRRLSPIEGAMLVRSLLAHGYEQNPELLKAAATVAQASGLPFTVPELVAMAQVPPGWSYDVFGAPLGSESPFFNKGATAERTRFSREVLPTVVASIRALSGLDLDTGLIHGSIDKIISGELGSPNSPYYGELANLSNIATAWARIHNNSVQSIDDFRSLLSMAQSSDNIKAALQAIEDQMLVYATYGMLPSDAALFRNYAMRAAPNANVSGPTSAHPAPERPEGRPVYKGGKLIGYTMDGRTMIPVGGAR